MTINEINNNNMKKQWQQIKVDLNDIELKKIINN